MTELIELPDLGVVAVNKLAASGVVDVDSLLDRGKDLSGQETIATTSVLNMSKVRYWIRLADLLRVEGIDIPLAMALVRSEFSTVNILAQATPEIVSHWLAAYVAANPGKLPQVPSLEFIQALIARAGSLAVIVTLPEDYVIEEVSLQDAVEAGNCLVKDKMWRTVKKLGDFLLYHAVSNFTTLADEDALTSIMPVPPPGVENLTLDDIQEIINDVATWEDYNFPPDFTTIVSAEMVQQSLTTPCATGEPITKEDLESLPKLVFASDLLGQALFNLAPAELNAAEDGTEDSLANVTPLIWDLEARINQAAFLMQRALSIGDLVALDRWLAHTLWTHSITLKEIATLQARLSLISSPQRDYESARWYATLETARLAFITNQLFTAWLLAQLRAKKPLADLIAQAQSLPFRQNYWPDVTVAALLTGSENRQAVRVIGRRLPPGENPAVVTIQDFTDADQRLDVFLPQPFAYAHLIAVPVTFAAVVYSDGAADGRVSAVPYDTETAPSDWQTFIARTVSHVFSMWPNGAYTVLFPLTLDTNLYTFANERPGGIQ